MKAFCCVNFVQVSDFKDWFRVQGLKLSFRSPERFAVSLPLANV
jgi:hypothetical protein